MSKTIEALRSLRDERFFKPGGSNELTLIAPAFGAAEKKSLRLFFRNANLQRIELVLGSRDEKRPLVELIHSLGAIPHRVFLASAIASCLVDKLNEKDNDAKGLAANEDAVLELFDRYPGIQKYWAPIIYVAIADAHMRDVYAPQAAIDLRKEEGESGELTRSEP